MNVIELLSRICSINREIFGKNLTGVYLHGSLAFGCFSDERSDVDFITVLSSKPDMAAKTAMIRALLDLPAPKKGIEMSVVLRSVCKPFIYPTPFELHYSEAHRDSYLRDLEGHIRRLQGDDPDLAAHFTVIRKVGKALCGDAIEDVFGEVPEEYYLDSILRDVSSAPEDIIRDPVYATLNLCRTLGYLMSGEVMSKRRGGEWGLKNLPEHRRVIENALLEYSSGEGKSLPDSELSAFAEDILRRINNDKKTLVPGDV